MSAPPLPFVARWLELERTSAPAQQNLDAMARATLQVEALELAGPEQWVVVRVDGRAHWLRGPRPRSADGSRAWWRERAEQCFELHRTPARRRA